MLFWLIILFTTLPVLELLVLIELGKNLGTWPTIILVLGTGVVGAALAKTQGFIIFNRIRFELSRGKIPAKEMINGLLVLIGGILLLTPGVLTDITGLLMLFTPTQFWLGELVRRWLAQKINQGIFYLQIGGERFKKGNNNNNES